MDSDFTDVFFIVFCLVALAVITWWILSSQGD
jgi:hypothetical protein